VGDHEISVGGHEISVGGHEISEVVVILVWVITKLV
jgi:hypothetical protein